MIVNVIALFLSLTALTVGIADAIKLRRLTNQLTREAEAYLRHPGRTAK